MIKEFSIENIRCFKGKQTVNIRPITFLIGENSTGKTTLLGCLQALLDVVSRPGFMRESMDFNNPPYDMGTFVDIVRRETPKLNTFQIGFQFGIDKERTTSYVFRFVESREGTEPILDEIIIKFKDAGEIIFNHSEQEEAKQGDIFAGISKKDGNCFILSFDKYAFEANFIFQFLSDIDFLFRIIRERIKDRENAPNNDAEDFFRFIEPFKSIVERAFLYSGVYSFAPMRSKPKRVYVPIKETEDPEGSHIYMRLNNIYRTYQWTSLQEKLNEFGKQSGMFDDIDVRRLGEHKTDPFQIQTTIRGQKNNIIDVGYGVSQILPVLATILQAKNEIGTFAIQQPEVHLHPKAQAALSSLLINIAKEQEKSFIIETHSDAMVDRARIEVMKGTIAPEDVSIVYLEPENDGVKIHNITMDDQGNLEHVPQGYRDFFTKETDDLLGWS